MYHATAGARERTQASQTARQGLTNSQARLVWFTMLMLLCEVRRLVSALWWVALCLGL